jgi:hypothetical protein
VAVGRRLLVKRACADLGGQIAFDSADQAIGDWTIVRFASGQQDGDQSMIAERGVLLIE